ncbi:hypothetical protein GCM10027168_62980 [Streptomyces capparidis]
MTDHQLLAEQVTRSLEAAGLQVAGGTDVRKPGLRVRPVAGGVLITWTSSAGLASLAEHGGGTGERGGSVEERLREVVLTAVVGLLTQLGHSVAPAQDLGGLLVTAEGARRGDPGEP